MNNANTRYVLRNDDEDTYLAAAGDWIEDPMADPRYTTEWRYTPDWRKAYSCGYQVAMLLAARLELTMVPLDDI